MSKNSKEVLLERFEVISRAADDCTYILMDSSLSEEQVQNKLYARLDRINDERRVLERSLDAHFIEPSNSIATNNICKPGAKLFF